MTRSLRTVLTAWLAARTPADGGKLAAASATRAEAHDALSARLRELEQWTQDIMLLGEMSELLQGSQTLEDARAVIARYAPRFFHRGWGGIYVINASRTLAEAFAQWGDPPAEVPVFEPGGCWAIRTGRPHLVKSTGPRPFCPHALLAGDAGGSLCVPMVAQGEALGVLHLASPPQPQVVVDGAGTPLSPTIQGLASALAQQVALSLANLRLRETLREQSIRDPLTGLYNRRYLEETMEREVARAKRMGTSLGMIMLDVDHFKRFNDVHGHKTGDDVLRALSRLLRFHLRTEDIVCRYGGEEFMIVMPGASLETTRLRAELLRQEASYLTPEEVAAPNSVTFSLGVAEFPSHGDSWHDVVAVADAALYHAKHEGRNRVVVGASFPRSPRPAVG